MTKDGLKRKLAAILSADVEGYSRLMGDDEVGTIRTLAAYKEAMISLIGQYSGRVVDSPGDNLLAEFASAVDAVQCAVEIQRELAERNQDRSEDSKMFFRIGVNVGDVIDKEEKIYGDGVNIAARVEGLAEAGGICISGRVYDQVENKLDLEYEFLGEQKVKNITRPVRIYRVRSDLDAAAHRVVQAKQVVGRKWRKIVLVSTAVVVVGAVIVAGWQFNQWQSTKVGAASVEKMAFPLPDKPSIAVLPFDNLSDDPKQEYFCDGMTEDLITDLSKISGMLVIARNSTFAYKGKPVKIRQVAEELGVRYVLEGSVRKAENKVRITAQLIDAISGHHIWANRYDGKLKDIFALQDKVARSIVTALAVQLTAGDEERVARRGTEDVQAYDAFLRGWENYRRQTPDDFRRAISYFEKAVDLDPHYARAYAALAATYWEIWKRLWHEKLGLSRTANWHEPRYRAEQFLAKAMQNPTSLAHQVVSAKLLHLHQYEEAIAEAQRAIALDPNDAESYVALADTLTLAGRADEALNWVERAMRLNPHYPSYYLYQLGLARFGLAQFDKAAISLGKATALNPDDRWSYRLLLATYGHLGRSEDAKMALQAIKKRDKRGWQNSIDPLTIRSSAFWLPFKEPADAERLAQGLRKAGIPD
jgi:TolB-like protein/class 3 adenylate cyclase/Flp pilus assembly protein TadD